MRIFYFAEWREHRVYGKYKCATQTYQECYPMSSNQLCVEHYEQYVRESLDDKFKPIPGGGKDA